MYYANIDYPKSLKTVQKVVPLPAKAKSRTTITR